jgi:hypothetical protein
VLGLKDYLNQRRDARRRRHPSTTDVSEAADDIRTIKSLGLDAATVALPAGISLEERAARMNSFWRALVDFQRQDVLVVAICSSEER